MLTVIIGGGAAGLMCAGNITAGNIMLLERNEKLGKKLYITGKGRCNLTNLCEPKEFLENVVTNSKFLISSIYGFSSQGTCNFIEENGCKLKVERGRRVFPVSDKSSDVIKAFNNALQKNSTEVILNIDVKAIQKEGSTFKIITCKNKITCDNLVLACGGVSYPLTGSNGDGYKFAKMLGHTIVPPKAALVPIIVKENTKSLAGLSLKNVELSVKDSKIKSFFGEMLFTGEGVSGPIVLSLSSYLPDNCKGLRLLIDLKPAIDEETLDKRILLDFSNSINKQLKNSLNGLMPKSLIPYIIEYCNFNQDKPVNLITKEERQRLVKALKSLEFEIIKKEDVKLGIITAGGVDVKEINPKTMESKLTKGLYFAGEIMDVDALTGGFNLQIAFSTAVSAANAINHAITEDNKFE